MNKEQIIKNYHTDALQAFRSYKKLAERALEQITDEQFFAVLDAESNSIAITVKHIAGNLLSRWRDFLKSDGEKENRHRDTEFEIIGDTRESLMRMWERGWRTLFKNVEPLTTTDFTRTVTIRGEAHSVAEAINRQLTHYAYHVGQIVFLAKHLKASEWKTLSIPRNRSAEFNEFLAEKKATSKTPRTRMEAGREFQKKKG